MSKVKIKRVPFIWCHYKGDWVPLGRAKKRCPVCSAVLKRTGNTGHRFKKKPLT